ncbi:MAG: hypothetical protein ACO1OB_31655 [Archangium sp.]
MARALALGLLLLLCSCGAVKSYQLPVTATEGRQLVSALIAECQQRGLYAFRGNGALTELEDGSQLSWQPAENGTDFELRITIPNGVPEAERAAYFDAAKSKADDIWNRATRGHRPAPAVAN